MEARRTIRVTGQGALKLHPDLTRLSLTLQGSDMDYGTVLQRSAEETEALRDVLASLGFAREALKTLQFNVDTLYEGYQDEKGIYRNRFTGYQFQHTLKLEFPSDNALLGRTLYALAHSAVKPEFRIGYTLSDPEGAKNALLDKAVRDARAKAEVLAAAAGETLGALLRIDYSWSEADIEVRPMRKLALADAAMPEAAGNSYDMSIEPEDLALRDSVTVLWALE